MFDNQVTRLIDEGVTLNIEFDKKIIFAVSGLIFASIIFSHLLNKQYG